MSRNRTRYTHAQDTPHSRAKRHMSRNKTPVTQKDTCHDTGHATHTQQDTQHTCMCMCVVSCCVTCARCVLLRVCVVSRCVSRNHTQHTLPARNTTQHTHVHIYKGALSHILNLQGQVLFFKEPAPGTQQDTAHTKHTKQTKRT